MVHTEWVSLYIYHKLYWLSFSLLGLFFLCYSTVSDQTLFSLVVISFLNFIVKPSLQLYTILHCIVIDPAWRPFKTQILTACHGFIQGEMKILLHYYTRWWSAWRIPHLTDIYLQTTLFRWSNEFVALLDLQTKCKLIPTAVVLVLVCVRQDVLHQSGERREAPRFLDDCSLATRRYKFHCCHEAWVTGLTSHSQPC